MRCYVVLTLIFVCRSAAWGQDGVLAGAPPSKMDGEFKLTAEREGVVPNPCMTLGLVNDRWIGPDIGRICFDDTDNDGRGEGWAYMFYQPLGPYGPFSLVVARKTALGMTANRLQGNPPGEEPAPPSGSVEIPLKCSFIPWSPPALGSPWAGSQVGALPSIVDAKIEIGLRSPLDERRTIPLLHISPEGNLLIPQEGQDPITALRYWDFLGHFIEVEALFQVHNGVVRLFKLVLTPWIHGSEGNPAYEFESLLQPIILAHGVPAHRFVGMVVDVDEGALILDDVQFRFVDGQTDPGGDCTIGELDDDDIGGTNTGGHDDC